MRIKLNFLSKNKIFNENNSNFKKIIFPVNLNEITFVKELKNKIKKTLLDVNLCENVVVEYILLDDFMLLDISEVKDVIKNDDELK